jgi:hypothetical protein
MFGSQKHVRSIYSFYSVPLRSCLPCNAPPCFRLSLQLLPYSNSAKYLMRCLRTFSRLGAHCWRPGAWALEFPGLQALLDVVEWMAPNTSHFYFFLVESNRVSSVAASGGGRGSVRRFEVRLSGSSRLLALPLVHSSAITFSPSPLQSLSQINSRNKGLKRLMLYYGEDDMCQN